MSESVWPIGDISRLDAAAVQIVQAVQRGRLRPGESLDVRSLAERFRVRPARLRSRLDGLRRPDLFEVRPDVIEIAPLDLNELRAGMGILRTVVSDSIARSSDRVTAAQLEQLQRFVASMPSRSVSDPDLYDTGRVFTQRLIGVVASRYEQDLYTHTCDMVRRYEELGAVVLEQDGAAPTQSAHDRSLIRIAACQGLVDLCRSEAATEVAVSVRSYYAWAGQVAELSFDGPDIAVRRSLRSVG